MNLIDRSKIYGRAALKTAKDALPKRQPKPKPDLKQTVDKGRRLFIQKGPELGRVLADKGLKAQRNNILGITREGGQAVDDLIELGNRGNEVMSRRSFLREMFNKAKQHNPPKAADPIVKRLPIESRFSINYVNPEMFVMEYKQQTGLLGK